MWSGSSFQLRLSSINACWACFWTLGQVWLAVFMSKFWGKPLYSQIEPKATVAVGAEYLRNLSLSCVEPSHALLPGAMTIIAFSRDHRGKDFFNFYKDVIIPCYFQIHVFVLYKKRGQALSLSLFLSGLFIALCCFSFIIGFQTALKCSWKFAASVEIIVATSETFSLVSQKEKGWKW